MSRGNLLNPIALTGLGVVHAQTDPGARLDRDALRRKFKKASVKPPPPSGWPRIRAVVTGHGEQTVSCGHRKGPGPMVRMRTLAVAAILFASPGHSQGNKATGEPF